MVNSEVVEKHVTLVMLATALASVVAHAEPAAKARPSTPIALPDLLAAAIRQSPTITRASVDVLAARADVTAAAGLDDFTLRANGGVSRTHALELFTYGTRGVLEQDALHLGVGLERGFSSGGRLTLEASGQVERDKYEPDGQAALNDHGAQGAVSATLEQPLLRGYGAEVARADRRRARVATDVATLEETVAATSLCRDVIALYWQVLLARQVVEIRAEGLRLAQDQLKLTQNEVRTGAISPTETLEAEQTVALREHALLLAQVAVSEQSLQLRRRAGLEVSANEIDLAPTTALPKQPATFDVDPAIARAVASNPLLALIVAKGRSAQIEVEVSDDGLRPRLDVVASVGAGGYAGTTANALQQLGTFDHPNLAIGLQFEQQLGTHAAKGASERAAAGQRRTRIDYEAAKREVSADVAHAVDVANAALKRIEVTERAVGLAKRIVEVQQTRFANGKSTNFEVSLRQSELQQAQLDRAQAFADAAMAEVAIQALTGELLDRYHVQVAPP